MVCASLGIGSDNGTFAVQMKRSRSSVGNLAAGLPDLKEPLAFNHHVEGIARLTEVTLRK